jgi:hypothetical protein
MEILLTRGEIRTLLRASLGQTTDESLGAQTAPQYNAFIDLAHLKALSDCRWVSSLSRTTTIALTTGQFVVPWPTGFTPGDLLEASIWDATKKTYTPLEKRSIPTAADTDQLQALGGADWTNAQGTPRYIEALADGLHLWPPNDALATRKVRMELALSKVLASDGTSTVIDGRLVLLWALSLAWGVLGDTEQQQSYQAQYQDRLMELRAWQSTGQTIAIASDAMFGDDEDVVAPNWDRRPTVR